MILLLKLGPIWAGLSTKAVSCAGVPIGAGPTVTWAGITELTLFASPDLAAAGAVEPHPLAATAAPIKSESVADTT